MFLIGVLATSILLLLIYNFYWKRRPFPPGPTPLPLVGNVLTIARHPPGYAAFQQWQAQYGPVFTYWISEIPVVAVTDYATIKETFIRNGDAYAGRDFLNDGFACLTEFIPGVHGVVRTEGEEWRVLRRFSAQVLKDLGMGKVEMEDVILDEVQTLFELVDKEIDGLSGGGNVDTMARVEAAVGSVITRLIFGYQLKKEAHSMFGRLKKIMNEEVEMSAGVLTKLSLVMPSLRHLPFFSSAFAAYDRNITQHFEFYDKQIQRIQAERANKNSEMKPTSYVEAFLAEIDKDEGHYFTLQALRGSCFELYGAGQVERASLVFIYSLPLRL